MPGVGEVKVTPQVPPGVAPLCTVKPAPIVVRSSRSDVIVAAGAVRLLSVIVIVVDPVCSAGVVNALLPVMALIDSVPLAAAMATPP